MEESFDDPMRYEERRLETFKRNPWPGSAPIACENLAKAGFYYAGHGDEVICFACGGKHSGWKLNDKAFAVHSAKFPLCPFVRHDSSSGNVSLVNYKVPGRFSQKALLRPVNSYDFSGGSASSSNNSKSVSESSCCDSDCLDVGSQNQSSEGCPHLQCCSSSSVPCTSTPNTSGRAALISSCSAQPCPRNLSKNRTSGFFAQVSQSSDCSGSSCSSSNACEVSTSADMSFVQQTVGSDMETDVTDGQSFTRAQPQSVVSPSSRPAHRFTAVSRTRSAGSLRRNQSPSSVQFFRSVFKPHQHHNQNGALHQQHDVDLHREDERLRTFVPPWNRQLPSSEQLSRYGFFYTGRGDMVKCAFCGGRLNKWCDHDDPRDEHFRHFPQCPFMLNLDVGNVPIISGFKPRSSISNNENTESLNGELVPQILPSECSTSMEVIAYQNDAFSDDDQEVFGLEFILPALDVQRREVSIEIEEAGSRARQNQQQSSDQQRAAYPTVCSSQPEALNETNYVWAWSGYSDPPSAPNNESPLFEHVLLRTLGYEDNNDEIFLMPEQPYSTYAVTSSGQQQQGSSAEVTASRLRNVRNNNEHDHDYDVVYPRVQTEQSRPAPLMTRDNFGETNVSTLELGPLIRSLLHGTTITMNDNDAEDESSMVGEAVFGGESNSTSTLGGTSNQNISKSFSASHALDFEKEFRRRVEELGIFLDKPCRADMATVSARLETFTAWPSGKLQQPTEMAEAGFFYCGKEDDVICFQCSGTLHNWLPTDDAWTEHARHFPRCHFVLLNKGENFVKLVLNKFGDLSTQEQCGVKAGENAPEAPLVSSSEPDVNINVTPASLQRQDRCTTTETLETLAAKGVDTEAEQIQQAIGMGFPVSLIVAALVDNNCAVFKTVHDLIDTMENLRALYNGDETNCNSTNLVNHSMDMREENRFLKEQRVCKICMDAEVSVVFLPCGHLVSCPQCSPALLHCPICRKAVKATVRTYMS